MLMVFHKLEAIIVKPTPPISTFPKTHLLTAPRSPFKQHHQAKPGKNCLLLFFPRYILHSWKYKTTSSNQRRYWHKQNFIE